MEVLETFLQDLYTNVIQIQLSENEVSAIQSSVEQIVERLLRQVAVEDSRFKVCDILKVGSYYEGTKICQPDEFDFLVQLEELSDPTKYMQSVNCLKNLGSVHVHAKSKEYKKWNPNCEPSFNVFPPQYVHSLFSTSIERAVESLIKSNTNTIANNIGCIELTDKCSGSGPNTAVAVTWKTDAHMLDIGVDITPFIPSSPSILRQWKDIINPTLPVMPVVVPPSPANLYLCKSGEGMHGNACWRLSFTPAEVHTMKTLHEHHRKCYKILKYLSIGVSQIPEKSPLRINNETSLKLLSSYILKNAVLCHSDGCDGEMDVHACIKEIFDYLLTCTGTRFLPNYFVPERNTWPVQRFTREVMVPNVLQLFHNTLFTTVINTERNLYNFEKSHEFLRKIIKRAAIMEKRHIDKYDARDKGDAICHREAAMKRQISNMILKLPPPSYFQEKDEKENTEIVYQRDKSQDSGHQAK